MEVVALISMGTLGRGALKVPEVINGLAASAEIIDSVLDYRREICKPKENMQAKQKVIVASAVLVAAVIAYKFFGKNSPGIDRGEPNANCAIKQPNPIKPIPPTQNAEKMKVLAEA